MPNQTFSNPAVPYLLKGEDKRRWDRSAVKFNGGLESLRRALFNDVPVLMQSSLKIRPECMRRTGREVRPVAAPPSDIYKLGSLFVCCTAQALLLFSAQISIREINKQAIRP